MATIDKNELISVLVSTSPIPSHPSTAITDETIASIRWHLPTAKIYLLADGVREEQKDREADYKEYLRRMMKKMLFEDENLLPVPFQVFTHQARMAKQAVERLVHTPLVLFVEHDTPLMDRLINWHYLISMILGGATNHVRLHYDEQIHPDHQHMMRGYLDDHLIKCVQFHNRPYLTNTVWFRMLLAENIRPQALTWIEDKVYSPISCAPWESYRLTIYDPDGTGQRMKRSRDLNGRAGDTKYDPQF